MRVWIPMSRLTYTFYLVNPFLISSIYLLSGYPLYTDVLMTVSKTKMTVSPK